jgi:hypothetical protein
MKKKKGRPNPKSEKRAKFKKAPWGDAGLSGLGLAQHPQQIEYVYFMC